MKQTRTMVGWLVTCGIALAMITNVSAGDAKARTGKVVRIKGAVRYSTGNNVWQPLKLGETLKAGAIIQTAKGGSVDIGFEDQYIAATRSGGPSKSHMNSFQPTMEQDMVRLGEDSVISVDKLTVVETGTDTITETELDLRKGRVFGTTKKMSAGSQYKVKIPNGIAGVRGTIYTVSADGLVQVLVGSVVVAYTQPDGTVVTQVVNGGYQYDARSGQMTPIPDFNQHELVREAKEARIGPNTPPTTFAVDQTLYYVSPRTGNNGNNGSNGGGGGGNTGGGE
jgi:hypothetical protein